MTRYDFDTIIDRTGTNCIKWDYLGKYFQTEDVLPMWVADMDFPSPPEVIRAMEKRASHGVYGYTNRPVSYYQAVQQWLLNQHRWSVKQEWITDSPGVIPAVSLALRTFTNPGDKVLIQSPVYRPFFSVVTNNQRQLVNSPLKLEDGRYFMDAADLQEKISDGVKAVVLCSPHNPVGRVWQPAELLALGQLCIEHDVLIIADEIWADIVYPQCHHSPIASLHPDLAERTITCIAPSKTFNLAGLNTSSVVIPNADLFTQFEAAVSRSDLDMGNIFGITALETAYREGRPWLEQLLEYLQGNLQMVRETLAQRRPQVQLIEPEGTYLAWLDFRGVEGTPSSVKHTLLNTAKVALNDGASFGEGGSGFQRMNIATPRPLLREGLDRIVKAFDTP